MIAPPPDTLHVEGAAHETRILLEHGRPRAPTVPWKRAAIALWFASLILAWIFPVLFCPLGTAATLLVGLAIAIDASRREVDRLVLRMDHLRVVQTGLTGRSTTVVPWSALEAVTLAPSRRGQVLVLTWTEDGTPRRAAVGPRQEEQDLTWMCEAFQTILHRTTATPDDADEVVEDLADVVDDAASEGAGAARSGVAEPS